MKNQISIEQVKRVNRQSGKYFFNADTMRFFSSRVSDVAVLIGDDAYFVTSEKRKCFGSDPGTPRLFSVRKMNMITGNVDAIGGFQAHKRTGQAWKVIAEIERTKNEVTA